MKHLLLVLFVFVGISSFAQASYWERLNAPPGGAPEKITPIANGWIYAEFYNRSMYCSKDGGASWELIFEPSDDPATGFRKISVGQGGTLFAEKTIPLIPDRFDVYKSTDNGVSWQLLLDSLTIHGVGQTSLGTLFAIRELDHHIYTSQIIRSDDLGASWQIVHDSIEFYTNALNLSVSVDVFDNLFLSGSYYQKESFISIDSGHNWLHKTFGGLPEEMFMLKSGTIIYTDHLQIIRSTMSGQIQVTEMSSIVPPDDDPYIRGLVVMRNGDVLATSSKYLFRTTDDGISWQIVPTNAAFGFLIGKWSLPDGSVFFNKAGYMYKAANAGQSAVLSSGGLNTGGISKLYLQSDSCWLALSIPGLWKTTDQGQHWNLIKESLFRKELLYAKNNLVWNSSEEIYFLNNDSLLYSENLGQSFQTIPLTESLYTKLLVVRLHEASHSIFVNYKNGLARSVDMGNSWQLVADSFYVSEMITHPSGALYATLYKEIFSNGQYEGYKVGLYRSQDAGETWQLVLNDTQGAFTINIFGEIFVKVFSGLYRIQKSVDGGNTWTETPWDDDLIISNSAGQSVIYAHSSPMHLSNDSGVSSFVLPKIVESNTFYYDETAFDDSNRLYTSIGSGSYIHEFYRSAQPTSSGVYLSGIVYKDADADCSTPDVEETLAGRLVKAQGADTWWATTDSAGRYTMFLNAGAYLVSVEPVIHLLWEACNDNQPVQLSVQQDTVMHDLPIKAIADCPYMTVDVAAPWLERCFENPVFVQYCNLGALTTDSAWLDVALDPYLTFTDTQHPIPHELTGNNTIRFYLGTVETGQCGNFSFKTYVNCDSTLLGQTLCIAAHIYPDSLCVELPEWSGAEIQVVAHCEQDTVLTFQVTNTGDAASQALQYFVIEDDVVMLHDSKTYGPHETFEFSWPANGHFRRFESQQEPGHPFSMHVAAGAEGCGGFNTLGFPNWYFTNNGIPSQSIYCGEIVGAFDPNDKQGLPLGYGDEHLLPPNTDMDYMIRFQNTGTAPAHHVIIRDTLSALLDPGSLRVGTASHPFTWELNGRGFLTLRFNDINLPDSNSNEAASHGFVRFKISQQPDLPDASLIRNTASIYFDFNEAVRTNETTHRIDRSFIEYVAVDEPVAKAMSLRISPNPAANSAVLTVAGLPPGEHYFNLTDTNGKVLSRIPFSGNELTLLRQKLASGLYFFQITDNEGVKLGSGKIVIR